MRWLERGFLHFAGPRNALLLATKEKATALFLPL
jgi:hypothetical protein